MAKKRKKLRGTREHDDYYQRLLADGDPDLLHTFAVQVTIWKGATKHRIEDRWYENVDAHTREEAVMLATKLANEYIDELLPKNQVYGISIGNIDDYGGNILPFATADTQGQLVLPKPRVVAKLPAPPTKAFSCPIIALCTNMETLGLPRRSIRLD